MKQQLRQLEATAMETIPGLPTTVVETVHWLMAEVEKEIWELENQGLLNEDNVTSLMAHLASAHHYARQAKWQAVEHLKGKALEQQGNGLPNA